MNWLDPIGALFSLSSTFLFTHAKRFAWVISFIAIIINIILYWEKQIYGRLMLDVFYCLSACGGLFLWGGFNKNVYKPITSLTYSQSSLLLLAATTLSFGFGLMLQRYTNSTIPFLDAYSTVGSMVAQCLLCFKIIQCWLLWFFIDILVAILQFKKGMPFHASTHVLYVGLAVYGYYRWSAQYRAQRHNINTHAYSMAHS